MMLPSGVPYESEAAEAATDEEAEPLLLTGDEAGVPYESPAADAAGDDEPKEPDPLPLIGADDGVP